MAENDDQQWVAYLETFSSRMGTSLTQIVGYSGILALMIQDLTPDAALEMTRDIQLASQELIKLRSELLARLPDPPTEKAVSPQTLDQKWRKFLDSFLSTWSLPLTGVLSNAQMIEIFLEVLVQRDNTPISIESSDLKMDVTPQMMLDRIRTIRDSAQELSRLKHKVYDGFDKPYSESERGDDDL